METKSWKLDIDKVKRNNNSKYITLPFLMAQDMGIEIGDYVRIVYDEEKKEMTVTKIDRGV